MPYVNVRITDEGATAAQKAEIIDGVTSLLQRVLGKNPSTTVVVIDEVPLENWPAVGRAPRGWCGLGVGGGRRPASDSARRRVGGCRRAARGDSAKRGNQRRRRHGCGSVPVMLRSACSERAPPGCGTGGHAQVAAGTGRRR